MSDSVTPILCSGSTQYRNAKPPVPCDEKVAAPGDLCPLHKEWAKRAADRAVAVTPEEVSQPQGWARDENGRWIPADRGNAQ